MLHLQILGTGCKKCEKLAQQAETAARELGVEFTLEKIGDITKILEFDIIQTPGLVVNGRVRCSGTVPTVEEIKRLLLVPDRTDDVS